MQAVARIDIKGPIPAHAGEPRAQSRCCDGAKAYPRSRGGTKCAAVQETREQGLSPLTRGNLAAALCRVAAGGPIPAHAGEPLKVLNHGLLSRAYPRSRGGTRSIFIWI